MILCVIKQELNHIVRSCYQEAFSKYALGVWKFQISFLILCVKITVLFCYILIISVLNGMATANEDTSNLISLIFGIIFCFT